MVEGDLNLSGDIVQLRAFCEQKSHSLIDQAENYCGGYSDTQPTDAFLGLVQILKRTQKSGHKVDYSKDLEQAITNLKTSLGLVEVEDLDLLGFINDLDHYLFFFKTIHEIRAKLRAATSDKDLQAMISPSTTALRIL